MFNLEVVLVISLVNLVSQLITFFPPSLPSPLSTYHFLDWVTEGPTFKRDYRDIRCFWLVLV